jgi:hypothetical protein
MAAFTRRYLVERIAMATSVYLLALLREKPHIWVSWIGQWRRFFLLRHRFLSIS